MEKRFVVQAISPGQHPRISRRCFATATRWLKPILLLGVLGWASGAQAVIPAAQRTVLTNLYTSTNGASWTNATNWNGTTGTECTWFGVTCDAGQNNVVAIVLNANNLTGTLPALSALPALQNFQVEQNQLTGSIPALTGLTQLTGFAADRNQLTGSIPALTGLTQLQFFEVYNNKLTGSLPALSGLTSLQFFFAFSNQLTGSIPALAGLTALKDFEVYNNQLSGTIPVLSGLTALQYFFVFNNQLTGSIPALAGLTALKDFAADRNLLSGSIPPLTGLPALQFFEAYNNQLTGSIASLSGLPALQRIWIFNNRLSGPVPAVPASLLPGVSKICGNSLTASGVSATDAAWVAAAGNWQACQTGPVFPMTVTGAASVNTPTATVTAAIQYRPQDVGTTGSIYVFALAPANIVANVSAQMLNDHKGPVVRRVNASASAGSSAVTTDTPLACVLAQLTASGQLTAVTAGTMQAYLSGVLTSQGASVAVLNGISTALLSGAMFYVGYGANATAMINNGINRSVVTVPGTNVCQPQAPQTGWWWNPAEDGRGFGIEVNGNNLFMSGYLYDESGHATWIVSPGPISLDGSFFNATMYQVANGQTLTGAYKAPSPATSAGTITLSFTDARHGTLVWPGGAIPIVRFDDVIGSGGGITPAFVPENGWWWNASESGRGYFLEVKNNYAFIAGYMYEADGRPVWYLTQNPLTTPTSFSGSWLQVQGGQTLTGAYKKPTVLNANVGPVSIQFADEANATLTLPGGRQLAITRQRF